MTRTRDIDSAAGVGDLDGPSDLVQIRSTAPYVHPKTIEEFEKIHRQEYQRELDSCDKWIKWCQERKDTHGINFYQGKRSAHIFNNINMEQLIRILKREPPNG